MSESTLSLQYKDLAGAIGLFLGYGHGSPLGDAGFTSQQQVVVDDCLKSGLRQFYFPPPMVGTDSAYDWSFLKPVASVALPTNVQTVPLYDDFGGMEGEIYVSNPKSTQWWPLDFIGIGEILEQYGRYPTATGRPRLAAVEPLKSTGPTQGTRQQLHIWPIADTAYTLKFQYYVNPDYLNTAFPYHMGGSQHAETVRASCLMAAEEFLDNARGVWAEKFQERLLASISADRKSKPQMLGPNLDYSDRRRAWRRDDVHGSSQVSYKGVFY